MVFLWSFAPGGRLSYEALQNIEIPIGNFPNIMYLPFTPVGKHINGQLDYLAKLLRAWRHYKRNKELDRKEIASEAQDNAFSLHASERSKAIGIYVVHRRNPAKKRLMINKCTNLCVGVFLVFF